jgi:hypothetical protein
MFRRISLLAILGFSVMLLVGSSYTYADRDQPLLDGSFELQRSRTISAPWDTEGSGFKGIELNVGRRVNSSIRPS